VEEGLSGEHRLPFGSGRQIAPAPPARVGPEDAAIGSLDSGEYQLLSSGGTFPRAAERMRERVGRYAAAALCCSLCALLSSQAAAQAEEEPGATIELSGFLSASLFAQDRLFAPGNGQNAQHVTLEQDGPAGWWHGGDVRNTRLTLTASAPDAAGRWALGGTLELDLFGGFTAGGAFGPEQPLPRVRLAFVQGERGGTRLRLGQDWTPLAGHTPESVSHLAFPPGWGSTGVIGWRFPGLFLRHEVGTVGGARVALQAAAFRGGWDDEDDPARPSAGEAPVLPQLQARVDLDGELAGAVPWNVHLAGHFDRKVAPDAEAAVRVGQPDGRALAVGARIDPDPLTLMGGGYLGRAVGHHAAHISQFGDIRGWGAWLQGGVAFLERWSGWLFLGLDDPRDGDIENGQALGNRLANAMLRFDAGPAEIGLEWMHARTEWRQATEGSVARRGNQLILGALLSF